LLYATSPISRRLCCDVIGADDEEDLVGAEAVNRGGHENDYDGDVGGASVDASLSLEIPAIVDAGSDTDGDDDGVDMPLPVAAALPTPVPVTSHRHRPRTLSAKERLPIFQVLCTDDEETIDGADSATLTQKVISSSS
jgi:hypothetical protein